MLHFSWTDYVKPSLRMVSVFPKDRPFQITQMHMQEFANSGLLCPVVNLFSLHEKLLQKNRKGQLSHVTRKPVFWVGDQVRLKPVCSADETSYGLEISVIASRGVTLSNQRTRKALIRLRGCAGWSAPLLFAYGINRFSHDVAQFY